MPVCQYSFTHTVRGGRVVVPVPDVIPRFLCNREHLCFCPPIWARFPSLHRAARGQGLCFLPSRMEELLVASLPSPCCTTRLVLLCQTCVILFKSAREAGRRGGFLGGRRPSGMIPGEVRECGPRRMGADGKRRERESDPEARALRRGCHWEPSPVRRGGERFRACQPWARRTSVTAVHSFGAQKRSLCSPLSREHTQLCEVTSFSEEFRLAAFLRTRDAFEV